MNRFVESSLFEMLGKVVELTSRSEPNIPYTSLKPVKDKTWNGRVILIAFHLHPSFVNNERSVFHGVFNEIVPTVTMIS